MQSKIACSETELVQWMNITKTKYRWLAKAVAFFPLHIPLLEVFDIFFYRMRNLACESHSNCNLNDEKSLVFSIIWPKNLHRIK